MMVNEQMEPGSGGGMELEEILTVVQKRVKDQTST